MRAWNRILYFLVAFFIASVAQAEVMNVVIAKEIDDDHIIIVTAKGNQLLLEKWSMKFSPLSFEGKTFVADVSSMWVKIYIEGKGEFKWSIEKDLGPVASTVKSRAKESTNNNEKGYPIEVAHNDELFIINGEKYEAKTYCLGWDQGERVVFLEGSAFGACASAKLLNVNRNEVCEVWCE
jgi:hypothetical protein